jgi:histidyl-tRNA synthetase
LSGPIAEATLIQTARVMLAEEGYKSTTVEINSTGDKDSLARFSRELTAYYRKHINEMSADCRELFKSDPFELLVCQKKSCLELNSKAPRALDYLSESSRRHLEEILEYLEALKIPYNVNNNLVGNRKYCGETIFTIVSGDKTDKNQQSCRCWHEVQQHSKEISNEKRYSRRRHFSFDQKWQKRQP